LHPLKSRPVSLDEIVRYTRFYSVDLINDQPVSIPAVFSSYFLLRINYTEWTQAFLDNLSVELAKRGVRVTPDSKNKIRGKLSDFNTGKDYEIDGLQITVTLTSPVSRWSKRYEESGYSYGSRNDAIKKVMKLNTEKIMKDVEFFHEIQN